METLSLSKLNIYIRRAIALNFQDPIWISAEILSYKERNGHVYLELTEKDEQDNITAQGSAILWKNTAALLNKNQFIEFENILCDGNQVRLQVIVDFSVRYGLKLIIHNIDSAYTLGKIAQHRLQTIERLKAAGLWQNNKNLSLPCAIKSVAIVSSRTSSGYKDFEDHLRSNAFGYTFRTTLFDVNVQGTKTINEICEAISEVNKIHQNYDILVLIRGGGSKHDLLEFDSFEISSQISQSRIPVLSGIGHLIDESIADLSSYMALKTPTAVADFILDINARFEKSIMNACEDMLLFSQGIVSQCHGILEEQMALIQTSSRMRVFSQHHVLKDLMHSVRQKAYEISLKQFKKISEFNLILETHDTKALLKRGFTLTYKNNLLISHCDSLSVGDEIKTVYAHGEVSSIINKQ